MIMVTGLRSGEVAALKKIDFVEPGVFELKRTETKVRGEDGKIHVVIGSKPKTKAGHRMVVIPERYY